MPLRTWLEGSFRATWIAGGEAPQRPRRSGVEAEREVERLRDRLEPLLGRRLDWDESGPPRSATAMSADGFARPFQKARQEAYRRPSLRLCTLEPPELWLPSDFEGVLQLDEFAVASSLGVEAELGRLQASLEQDPGMEELAALPDGGGLLAEFSALLMATRKLRGLAALGVEHRVPVIVET